MRHAVILGLSRSHPFSGFFHALASVTGRKRQCECEREHQRGERCMHGTGQAREQSLQVR
jgi:hypothetical protein